MRARVQDWGVRDRVVPAADNYFSGHEAGSQTGRGAARVLLFGDGGTM